MRMCSVTFELLCSATAMSDCKQFSSERDDVGYCRTE